jgi:hypothetical protein
VKVSVDGLLGLLDQETCAVLAGISGLIAWRAEAGAGDVEICCHAAVGIAFILGEKYRSRHVPRPPS